MHICKLENLTKMENVDELEMLSKSEGTADEYFEAQGDNYDGKGNKEEKGESGLQFNRNKTFVDHGFTLPPPAHHSGNRLKPPGKGKVDGKTGDHERGGSAFYQRQPQ